MFQLVSFSGVFYYLLYGYCLFKTNNLRSEEVSFVYAILMLVLIWAISDSNTMSSIEVVTLLFVARMYFDFYVKESKIKK
jgi:hypothetical protein